MVKCPLTALVTGATGAIGQAIARGLARFTGPEGSSAPRYEVIVACRDPQRMQALVARLRSQTGNLQVRGELVDVASSRSIAELARRFEGPLDVLVNNAAVAPKDRELTDEGIERVWATNVLGYVRLTKALLPALRRAANARVVNVASYWAGDLEFDDVEFKRRRYDNDTAYRQSKQANRMLSFAWATRLRPDAVSVNCCHPGDVNSRLSNDLGFGGSESPDSGAATPVWLATSDEVQGTSGAYFEHGRLSSCRFSRNTQAVERLADLCEQYG